MDFRDKESETDGYALDTAAGRVSGSGSFKDTVQVYTKCTWQIAS
jgi:hypothetical protein